MNNLALILHITAGVVFLLRIKITVHCLPKHPSTFSAKYTISNHLLRYASFHYKTSNKQSLQNEIIGNSVLKQEQQNLNLLKTADPPLQYRTNESEPGPWHTLFEEVSCIRE